MEPIAEALRLLKRQLELQDGLRRSSTNRILDERELYLIRRALTRYPAAVQAIALTARDRHIPVEYLSVTDIERNG